MTGEPFAFHDLPRHLFPFTMRLTDAETGEEVWSTTVDRPGVVTVPGTAQHGHARVKARIEWADGTVSEADKP